MYMSHFVEDGRVHIYVVIIISLCHWNASITRPRVVVSAPLLEFPNLNCLFSLRTSMSPRPSISGELPIDSYFSSAGAISNRENGSRKRRTGAGADDTKRTQTKKQRTTQPSKATNLESQGKSRSGMICNIFKRECC